MPTGEGAIANLARLAAARELILANSTFSYWGAHLSNAHHGDNHALVIAPKFHSRAEGWPEAFHLDPRWTVIDDLPGGWDA